MKIEPGIIRTFSGQKVNVRDPHPDALLIEDIARSLSRIPRYLGHVSRFYSVAEHSVLIAGLLAHPDLIRTALLHDATEAYLGDVPATLRALPEWHFYNTLEDNLYKAIAKKFGALYPIPEEVKFFDKLLRHPERMILRGDLPDADSAVEFIDEVAKLSEETQQKIQACSRFLMIEIPPTRAMHMFLDIWSKVA